MRTRNALLQALHLLKTLDAGISVNEVIAFLYAAENEGLTVQDMARVSGLTQSTASRSLRALGPKELPRGRSRRRWGSWRPTSTPTTPAATSSSSRPAAARSAIGSTPSSASR